MIEKNKNRKQLMAQGIGSGPRRKATKSVGARRKHVGHTAKNMRSGIKNKDPLRNRASAGFASQVEADMSTRLPSDQRDKLTVLRTALKKGTEGVIAKKKLKHMKKPLTRGRKRKVRKAKGTK